MNTNWLKLGDWNANCDSCGRKFKASQLMKRWDGLMVCKEDFENRHPQNFLRVPTDTQAVPWSRPEPAQDIFIRSCNIINSQAISGVGVSGCMVSGSILTSGDWGQGYTP